MLDESPSDPLPDPLVGRVVVVVVVVAELVVEGGWAPEPLVLSSNPGFG